MNLICKNILEALCGNYVVVDLETTAIVPREGSIIAMGCIPFTLYLSPKTGQPLLEIHWESIYEFWFKNMNHSTIRNVHGHKETIEWHLNKNEAFPIYGICADKAGPADSAALHDLFNIRFNVNKYNFLSRHAFDSRWIEEKYPELHKEIHYRNFVDIANILKGTGITNNELYRELEARAVERAKQYQTKGLPDFCIPHPEHFFKHRAISDCFIDMFFMYEVMMYIWNNCNKNAEI